MLAHVLERAALIEGVDQVVLAVPYTDVRLVSHLWPHVFGGPEKDVLKRYALAAEKYEADVIMRVTGDCPLLAPDLLSFALDKYIFEQRTCYMPVCQPYNKVADGWDGEIFTMSYLQRAQNNASKEQREHVTTYFREHMTTYSPELFLESYDFTALKCSVDSRVDLQRAEKIMDHLEDKTDFSHQATWTAWERAGRP